MLALEEVRVKPVVVPTAKADPTVPLNVQVPLPMSILRVTEPPKLTPGEADVVTLLEPKLIVPLAEPAVMEVTLTV